MTGFWTKTPDGHTVHINGDPAMNEETRLALSVMLDEAAKQFAACDHGEMEQIHICHYGPHYTFVVVRCRQCDETTVKVMGNIGGDKQLHLGTLPTWIAPWASNKPSAGYAYYWRFDGLSHSTPAIAKRESGEND
jgi:hypothetical protein